MCNPTQCRYFAQAAHLVVSITRSGTIRGISPQSAGDLGHSAADLEGKSLADLLPANQKPHLARILERCKTDQSVWDELTVTAADGRRLPMLCCFQRHAAPGERAGLLVTGMKLMSFQAGGRTDAAALLGQLAFRCHRPAHRLMQALEAVLMQHPWSEVAERCRTELDGLLEIMSQSVSWPLGEGPGEGASSSRTIDVVQVLEGALRLMDCDPVYKGLAISLRPESASMWATAHPVGLVFLALHLARNARDATVAVPSPHLIIDVYCGKDQVVLEFKDNGSGLADEDLACAFTPFFHKAPQAGNHTGLGLTTCQELVQYMGGTIRMQSHHSEGTTVVVTLPAAAPPT